MSGLGLLACCTAIALGQTERRQLTLEWIFGPDGRTVASLPATAWLDDGTLILLDNRRPTLIVRLGLRVMVQRLC